MLYNIQTINCGKKLSLSVNEMIKYLENPRESTEKLLIEKLNEKLLIEKCIKKLSMVIRQKLHM